MQSFELEQHGSLGPIEGGMSEEVRYEALPLPQGHGIDRSPGCLGNARGEQPIDLVAEAQLHLTAVLYQPPLNGIVLRPPPIAWERERREAHSMGIQHLSRRSNALTHPSRAGWTGQPKVKGSRLPELKVVS